MMKNFINIKNVIVFCIGVVIWSCNAPKIVFKEAKNTIPEQFTSNTLDSNSIAQIGWRDYFEDNYLNALIDSALVNNQELNIVLQEIEISKNEVLEKKGEYLPFVDLGLSGGTDKVSRFTRDGAVERNLDIVEGKEFPEPLNDFQLGLSASWEVDIWRKLRNTKDAAQLRYLAQTEGRNFLVTQLVSEIAESYYELMALDNLLEIINRNVTIQTEAYEKVKQLKEYAKSNQLVVNRFKAQLLNTQNQQYAIKQKIVETENKIHFLTGTYPRQLNRNSNSFMKLKIDSLQAGIPSQLLENRPDIRQAELQMGAAKLDVKSAKANFYPKLDIKAGLGYQAFDPSYLFKPESLLFNAAGDVMAPLVNRAAIKAKFKMASAMQIQTVYAYEQTLLQAYTDVLNQLAKLDNYTQSVDTKSKEVKVLEESVDIANSLFQFAKADYVEVLLTQEEALDAEMELIETKLKQIHGKVQLYRALGGGWN
ncbi:MAG: TolC family protein [Winogradskyella sp.]|jgi:NodT family efflux transporter outer membrane factor (OMF) lipoprotein